MRRPSSITLALLAFVAVPVFAATNTAAVVATPMTPDVFASYDKVRPEADYIRRTAMIPMRDGVKLYTVIVMKKGTTRGPILLSRTPYGAEQATTRVASQRIVDIVPIADAEFVEDGYIRVYQDLRGMHKSEGVFVMTRPIVGPLNDSGIDESTDAYDTIAWLVGNLPEANGNVGITGSSYQGFTALMAEINPHSALKAAVSQNPMVDGWMGDDFFHNGAFRGSFGFALRMAVGKGDGGARIAMGEGDDAYSTALEAGSMGDFARKWGVDQVPFSQKLMQNPAYTPFWSLQAVDKWLAARPLSVPTMLIVGQWDQEDSYGAPAVYRALKPKDKNLGHRQRLGGQADRRAARRRSGAWRQARHGGLRVADRHRDLSRPLRARLRHAGAAVPRQGRELPLRHAQRRPRLPAGTPHHGAGAVQPVPAVRPQPADLCAQHLRRAAAGLPGCDAERLPGRRTRERRAAAHRRRHARAAWQQLAILSVNRPTGAVHDHNSNPRASIAILGTSRRSCRDGAGRPPGNGARHGLRAGHARSIPVDDRRSYRGTVTNVHRRSIANGGFRAAGTVRQKLDP